MDLSRTGQLSTSSAESQTLSWGAFLIWWASSSKVSQRCRYCFSSYSGVRVLIEGRFSIADSVAGNSSSVRSPSFGSSSEADRFSLEWMRLTADGQTQGLCRASSQLRRAPGSFRSSDLRKAAQRVASRASGRSGYYGSRSRISSMSSAQYSELKGSRP